MTTPFQAEANRVLKAVADEMEAALRQGQLEDPMRHCEVWIDKIKAAQRVLDDDLNEVLLEVAIYKSEIECWRRPVHLLDVVTGDGRFDLAVDVASTCFTTARDQYPRHAERLNEIDKRIGEGDGGIFDDG